MLSHLNTRLSLLLLGGLLFSVVTVGYLFNAGRSEALQREELARLTQDTRLVAGQLTASLQFLERDLRFLVRTPPVQGVIRAREAGGVDPAYGTSEWLWRKRLREIFAVYLETHPDHFQLRYIGLADGGRELVRTDRVDGRVVTVPDEELQRKGDRHYFQVTAALPEGAIHISEFDLNREHGEIAEPHIRTLRMATPVYDSAGELFGMVVANMDVGLTLDRLGHNLPEGVETYVVNERGDYLLHPEPGVAFGFDLGNPLRIQEEYPEVAQVLAGGRGTGEEVVHLHAGNDHVLHIFRVRFDPLQPERFVAVVLSTPASTLVHETDQALSRSLFLSSAAVVAALLVMMLLVRAFNKPMRALELAARRITRGDYDVQVPRSRDRALQVLGDAFQGMAETVRNREAQLRRFNQELEQRVAQRTADLSASEQRLREQQRLLQLIIDHIDDGVVVVDRAGRHLLTNPAAERHLDPAALGSDPGDWGRLCGVCSVQGEPTPTLPLVTALQGERLTDVELRLCNGRADGVWVNANASPLVDDGGEPQGAVMTLHDITERRHLEEQWRLIAAVFENSLEGIMITDAQKNIMHVNRAFATITGYTAEEALGRSPSMLSSGWQDAAFYQRLWKSIRETGSWQGELTNRRKDGALYEEWLNIFVVRDARGTVQNYVGMFYDITDRKEAERHISWLAYYDTLTELPNRRLFQDRVEQALHYARRHQQRAATLFIDLDRFKPVNDSLGHRAGDLLLQQVGQRLAAQVRESDTVARLGGDEFGIVAQDAGEREAQLLAERIHTALQEPFDVEGHEVFVSASIGISLYPEDGADMHTLLKHADIAMYLAKRRGRGASQFYIDSMNQGIAERLQLENALHRAIEREEFELHYQPQVDLHSGAVVGVEALIRWNHPERGLVMPGHFIPLAEESGLIDAISHWVLQAACRQQREWQRQGVNGLRVAVNLSARNFHDDIEGKVQRVLAETGVEPALLELELTESMLMTDPQRSAEVLAGLSALGVSLSVDDFGTGYSSLSYLKRFPIHRLKVDRSFVNGVPEDVEDSAITGTIIAMAHNLQLRVIAEGVERPEQVAFLRERGCHEAQGYLYSPPRPANELRALLEDGRRRQLPAA